LLAAKEAEMKIIGMGFHTRWQIIAMLDDQMAALVASRLMHEGTKCGIGLPSRCGRRLTPGKKQSEKNGSRGGTSRRSQEKR
jgi:hypothetical protein